MDLGDRSVMASQNFLDVHLNLIGPTSSATVSFQQGTRFEDARDAFLNALTLWQIFSFVLEVIALAPPPHPPLPPHPTQPPILPSCGGLVLWRMLKWSKSKTKEVPSYSSGADTRILGCHDRSTTQLHSRGAVLWYLVRTMTVTLWYCPMSIRILFLSKIETVADEGGPIRFRCRPKKFWEAMTDPSLRSIGEELCYATQCVALSWCCCLILWI